MGTVQILTDDPVFADIFRPHLDAMETAPLSASPPPPITTTILVNGVKSCGPAHAHAAALAPHHQVFLFTNDDAAVPTDVTAIRVPFRLQAVLARINKPATSATCRLYPMQRLLVRGDERCPLTEQETALIETLIKAPRGHCTHTTLLEQVWQGEMPFHTVTSAMHRLRSKLAETFDDATLLTSADNGYRLMVPVEVQDG